MIYKNPRFYLRVFLKDLSRLVDRGIVRDVVNRFDWLTFHHFNPLVHLPRRVCIQTIAKCNYNCDFCPSNKHPDLFKGGQGELMEKGTFCRIINGLPGDYNGWIEPFHMNEPLLDTRLAWFVAYIRNRLPRSRIRVNTNGALLNRETLMYLIDCGTDVLAVNDYTPNKNILHKIRGWEIPREYWRNILFYRGVTIDYKPDRFGVTCINNAGNNSGFPVPDSPLPLFCAVPFIGMYVGWNGDCMLCCSDWKFEVILGNVLDDSLLDIWCNKRYEDIRERLLRRERNMPLCRLCDYAGWCYADNLHNIRDRGVYVCEG